MSCDLERLKKELAGRYRIERELGQGGMAIVYLAHDEKHDRRVALKVLRPELAVGQDAERFAREILIAGRLAHPHIVGLHDSGIAGGCQYFVMPYIEGESLAQQIRRDGPLELEEAFRITRQVGEALDYAHNKQIVHRDIKPGNILLTAGGAMVADFGIAQALEQSSSRGALTETGRFVGTPEYTSPEQAGGSGPLDGRADQYCLALVLYEMLTGQPPFTHTDPRVVLARQQVDPPPPLRTARATVSEELESVVLRALSKLPVDRYHTMAEFLGQLPDESRVTPPSGTMEPQEARSFWQELKKRRVYQVAVAYSVACTGIIELSDSTFGAMGLPDAALRVVILVAIAGFPIALTGAWLFQITRDGVRRTQTRVLPPGSPREFLEAQARITRMAKIGLGVTTLAAGVAAGAILLSRPDQAQAGQRNSPAALRYALLPFDYESGVVALNETQRLHDALAHWAELTFVDPFRVREAFSATSSQGLSQEERARRVNSLGARWYVIGEVSRLDQSLRVSAGLYDALNQGRLVRGFQVFIPSDLTGAESQFIRLADGLLFGDPIGPESRRATRSLPARQSFAKGQEALHEWRLAAADSAFFLASELDDRFAEAQMWLALVRAWRGAEPARIRLPAAQAKLGRDRLSSVDQRMTDAVAAQSLEEWEVACPLWQRVTEDADTFAAWYGFAFCLAKDEGVLPDPASPSGWRFRTSYHQALNAYRRAFERQPSVLRSFRSESYASLRQLFKIGGSQRRQGYAVAGARTRFFADLAWRGDSLAFIPYPVQPGGSLQLSARPEEVEEAVRELREAFRGVALSWVGAAPQDPNALEALAISMSLLGDRSALDTLRRSRQLAAGWADEWRLAETEVWMQLSHALPHDIEGLGRARALADTLLRRQEIDPRSAAALAVLTGRADLAGRYARAPEARDPRTMPPLLGGDAPALLVFASLGGPIDSLRRLEGRVSSAIRDNVSASERPAARRDWLARPATLAFPNYRFTGAGAFAAEDYLLGMQLAWTEGDRARVEADFEDVAESRQGLLPATLTIDGLYPEARLLFEMGEPERAAAWLDPTLRTLAQAGPQMLASPPRAGSLVRAAVLRAEIAAVLRDMEQARLWATSVVALWSDADTFLQPTVRRMQELLSR